MLKGFKDFIMRGNVVDLAVGVVIGAAFTGVVTQLTKSFLEPLVRVIIVLITGKKDGLEGSTPSIRGIPFDWVAFVNAAITFAADRRGALLPGRLPDEPAGRAAQAGRGAAAGRARARRSSCSPRSGTRCSPAATPLPGQRGALDDVLGRRTEPPAPR